MRARTMSWVVVLTCAELLSACGGESGSSQPSGPQVAAPAVAPPVAPDHPSSAAAADVPTSALVEPAIDLLRAVPTTVRVSSVYRDQHAQIALVDAATGEDGAIARCVWAGARMTIRNARVSARLERERDRLETEAANAWADADGRDTPESTALTREADALERAIEAVDELGAAESNRGMARRVLRATPPPIADIADEWAAMRAHAEAVIDVCAAGD